jgi:hypothetical protein
MSTREEALRAARRFLTRHPTEIGRAMRSVLGLRLGVPIDGLRWLATQAEKSGKVKDLVITPVPPGIAIGATVDQMKTTLRISANVYVERVRANANELRIELRLEKVAVSLVGMPDPPTPVAMLVQSGVLDLSKPGDVVKRLPGMPPMIADASGDRIILDLMKLPAIAKNERLRRRIEVITSVLTVHGVETDEDHLDVSLRAAPEGVFKAARTVRDLVVRPRLDRARERIKLLRASFM